MKDIRWPTVDSEDCETAKNWVEDTGVPAEWREVWCLIDWLTIPLFKKPHYYRDAFFDRKNRYINAQNGRDIRYAAAWINSCIILHAYAIDEEAFFVDFAEEGAEFEQVVRAAYRVLDTQLAEGIVEGGARVRN